MEVTLLLPHIPDKKYAFALAKTHYRELLQAGVRILEYTPGFVHAKVFVSDDIKAVVGTINLDYRSLYLHFECAAYLYDVPAIRDIEADFQATAAQCQEANAISNAVEPVRGPDAARKGPSPEIRAAAADGWGTANTRFTVTASVVERYL